MDTISEILEKIEEAHSNKDIMDAFRVGTSTLKQTTKQFNLSKETVDEVIDDLSSVLADQREIDEAISTGMSQLSGPDDTELEEELEKMMKEEQKSNSTCDQITELISSFDSVKIVNTPPKVEKQKIMI